MKHFSLSTPMLIHLFAAAHALIATVSRWVNYVDDVPLTILTISLIVIIALRYRLHAEMIAVLTLVGTFAGYLLGSYGAQLIGLVISNPISASALTTLLYTELLGWSIYLFARTRVPSPEERSQWSVPMKQLILLITAILLFRFSYTLIFESHYFKITTSIFDEFERLLSNQFALLVLLCGNVIFVSLRPPQTRFRELRYIGTGLIVGLFSLLLTTIVYFEIPHSRELDFALVPFLRLFAVVLLSDIIVFALCKLVAYVIASRTELRTERGKKHLAQFQYNKLKMQINPHFLFNSLNILDFLVQEQETERASAFIRKLSECYRYMLKTEDEQLVSLTEELDFARKYAELLQERFADGFTIEYAIPREALSRHVIPCCLQLLIENATKHNVVSPERPLTIRIEVIDETLIVSNNLQPRLSTHASTGMGLKNIRRQYEDLAGRTIQIEPTKTEYIVKLPLL